MAFGRESSDSDGAGKPASPGSISADAVDHSTPVLRMDSMEMATQTLVYDQLHLGNYLMLRRPEISSLPAPASLCVEYPNRASAIAARNTQRKDGASAIEAGETRR